MWVAWIAHQRPDEAPDEGDVAWAIGRGAQRGKARRLAVLQREIGAPDRPHEDLGAAILVDKHLGHVELLELRLEEVLQHGLAAA